MSCISKPKNVICEVCQYGKEKILFFFNNGVNFSRPRFSLRPTMQPQVNEGLGSLTILEQQCFRHHFQDTMTKMSLIDSLVKPTILYGSIIWGPPLLDFDQASVERIKIHFLQCIIKCHRSTLHNIILVEFGAHPFRLGTRFDLFWLLHQLWSFVDCPDDSHIFSYLAYYSYKEVAGSDSGHRSHCWYIRASALLGLVGISMDHLPPFQFSLDTPTHLLPPQGELNEHIRLDIYRQYVITTWRNPPCGLHLRMAFYVEHFLDIQDGIILHPQYLTRCWTHALCIYLGSFRVGSHLLRIQTNQQINREDMICHLREVETKSHFIFCCPIYYEIRGRFYCLFKKYQSLFSFSNISNSVVLHFTFRRPCGFVNTLCISIFA